MVSPLFRSFSEANQPLGKRIAFSRTLSSNNSETVIDLTGHMEEGHRFTLAGDGFDGAYINFDADATKVASSDGTIHSTLIPVNTGISLEDFFISNKITAINEVDGSNATIHGIIWGR